MNKTAVSKWLVLLALLPVSVAPAAAGCLIPPASPEAINGFKSNPASLVAPDSDTRTVEATVRDLAGSDASLAADMIKVAESATPRFRTAIAAGLAQAAISCQSVDQQASLTIQQAVAGFEDGQFQSSFAAVAGDLSTAATDAALSSATGSVGSVVVVNPNNGPATNPPVAGSSGNSGVVASIALASSSASNPATITSTAADTVSPTH
jgi:hypothetical protein